MTLLDDARALATRLPTHTASHEAERRLAPEVVEALRDGGFLRVLLPPELGGHALGLPTYVELLATLAAGDAATAWVVMTASTSTLLAGFVERATAEAIWTPARTPLLAGVFAPGGRLGADGTLTGRWPYGSGCRHADWIAVGALTPGAGDRPRHVVCFVAADDPALRIEDNWDTLGLAGTGSHDLVVDGARVAGSHVASVFETAPWPAGVAGRLPLFGVLAAGIAACGVGIARAALDHVAARLISGAEPPPSTALARHGELHARLAAATAYLRATATATQAAAAVGGVPAPARGELRLAACQVAAACARVTRGAFHLGGGAGVRAGHPLQRALRDAEMVLTHRMVADKVIPAATRALLGVGAVAPDL